MSNPGMLAYEVCERRRPKAAGFPGGPPGREAIEGDGA
jgi:hypothetical protein